MTKIDKPREKGVPGARRKARGPTTSFDLRSLWVLAIPVLCAIWTYHSALNGQFVFDDTPTVEDNRSLETIGGFWDAAFGPKHSPISNRPVVCFTFALNYAFGGLNPFGYHLFNLLIHAFNSALLVLVLRRALLTPNLGESFTPGQALGIATAIATVWAVHPLATEAVTYVTQRTTLVMSTFILLTLYGTLRSATDVERPRFWQWFAVASCGLAMMSKEEVVALPILIVLFDRAYLFDSFAAAWARRSTFYLTLAATWLLLIACVVAGPTNPTVGYNTIPKVSAWEWLMTEAPVLVRYLRLTFWPHPLIVAYDWPFVKDLADVLGYGLLILVLLAGTVALWFRKPQWAWLGAMFFLLLAPTSSIMPIVSEPVAERRMYLPMLATLIPALLGLYWLGEKLGRAMFGPTPRSVSWLIVPVAVLVVVESFASADRAQVYNDEMSVWSDAYRKNELTNKSFMAGSILMGYAKPWLDLKNYDQAIPLLERSYACESPTIDVIVNLAAAYADVGRLPEAEAKYNEALQIDKQQMNANLLGNYSNFILTAYQLSPPDKRLGAADPRLQLAYKSLQRAIQINPRASNYHNTLASICFFMGRLPEAEREWTLALQLDPTNYGAASNRAIVLADTGRAAEALAILEPIHRQIPQDPGVLKNLVLTYLKLNNKQAALQKVQETLRVDPNNGMARALLQDLSK